MEFVGRAIDVTADMTAGRRATSARQNTDAGPQFEDFLAETVNASQPTPHSERAIEAQPVKADRQQEPPTQAGTISADSTNRSKQDVPLSNKPSRPVDAQQASSEPVQTSQIDQAVLQSPNSQTTEPQPAQAAKPAKPATPPEFANLDPTILGMEGQVLTQNPGFVPPVLPLTGQAEKQASADPDLMSTSGQAQTSVVITREQGLMVAQSVLKAGELTSDGLPVQQQSQAEVGGTVIPAAGKDAGLQIQSATTQPATTQKLAAQALAAQTLTSPTVAIAAAQTVLNQGKPADASLSVSAGETDSPGPITTTASPVQTAQANNPATPSTPVQTALVDPTGQIDLNAPASQRFFEAQNGDVRSAKPILTQNAQAAVTPDTGVVANPATGSQPGANVSPVPVPTSATPPAASGKGGSKTGTEEVGGTTQTAHVTMAHTDAASGAGASTEASGSAPATDSQARPANLPPHTIPMLAAAMMRRIHNGMKEFTLRLDPPELGRVDVRLTVSEDKKVRAVVTTDRPEALVDLALSARELTRALQDAGLELEDNGLTFSMNDPGNSQQQAQGERDETGSSAQARSRLDRQDAEQHEATSTRPPIPSFSGPVERWQRARITLTA